MRRGLVKAQDDLSGCRLALRGPGEAAELRPSARGLRVARGHVSSSTHCLMHAVQLAV